MQAKKGDWYCPSCHSLCFASKTSCYKCNTPKPSSQQPKPGDWYCSCGNLNFASRVACRNCNKEKPPMGKKPGQPPSYRAGDWFCPACNDMNFGTRIDCRKCGKQRDGNNKEKEKQDDSGECVICFEEQVDTCIKTCGHLALCGGCATKISACPICRCAFNAQTDLLKVYKASV